MKVAIMQPYFLPYIGYFQLIHAVDKFVIYDNIQYTKKGWINRNRILQNGQDEYISLPLKKDSDYLNVDQRVLADTFPDEQKNMLRKLGSIYRKAPHFQSAFPVIEDIYHCPEKNLFGFLFHSVKTVCHYLGIETEFVVSSTLDIDHSLKSEEKVIALCKALNTDIYLNPIGGIELYAAERFQQQGIGLQFIKSSLIEYPQFGHPFVPWLSILDVMMFNSPEAIKNQLDTAFTIIQP